MIDRRNYNIYAYMAGVRNYSSPKATPVAPARGFPEDAGFSAAGAYYLRISDIHQEEDGYASSEQASIWVAEGLATIPCDGSNSVSNPDFHTPSWLSADEFCQAVALGDSNDIYWKAIAALVRSIADDPLYECRVVFWFDN